MTADEVGLLLTIARVKVELGALEATAAVVWKIRTYIKGSINFSV